MLLDLSGSTKKSFGLAVNASRLLVQELSVSLDRSRIAVLTFTDFPTEEFGLGAVSLQSYAPPHHHWSFTVLFSTGNSERNEFSSRRRSN
jgi:hypothetical protein